MFYNLICQQYAQYAKYAIDHQNISKYEWQLKLISNWNLKKIEFFFQNILKLIQNTQFYHVIAINVI